MLIRLRRWIIRVLVVVVIAIAAGGAALAFLQTDTGKEFIKNLIVSRLNARMKQGEAITATRLEGSLPFVVRLGTLTLSDPEGPWLRLTDIEAHWNPLELLRGRYHVYSLSVRTISIERFPEHLRHVRSLPTLPTTLPNVEVDSVALPRVALGAEISPEPVSLAVTGKIDSEPSEPKLTFEANAKNIEGPAVNARAKLVLHARPASLDVALAYNEAAGGLVAHALHMTTRETLSANVTGQGPLSEWHGSVVAQAGEAKFLQTSVEIKRAEEWNIQASGAIEPPPGLLPPKLDELLGGQNTLKAIARFRQPSQSIEIEQLAVAGKSVDLNAQGTLDLAGQASNLHVRLDLPDLALFQDLAGVDLEGKASLDGTITGSAKMPVAQMTLAAKPLHVAKAQVQEAGGNLRLAFLAPVNVTAPTLEATGDLTVKSLEYTGIPPLPDKDVHVSFDFASQEPPAVEVKKFNVDNAALSAALSGSIDYHTLQVELATNVRVEKTEYWTKLASLPDYSSLWIGERVVATANVGIDKERHLKISDLDVSSTNSGVTGTGDYDLTDHSVNATVRVTLPRLSAFASTPERGIAGSVEGDVRVTGQPADLAVRVDAHGADIAFPAHDGKHVSPKGTAIHLKTAGRVNIPARTGTAQLDLESADISPVWGALQSGAAGIAQYGQALLGKRLAAHGEATWAGSKADLHPLTIKGEHADAEGDVSYDIKEKRLQSKWRLSLPDMTALSKPLGRPISGSMIVDGQLDGAVPHVRLSLTGQSKDLIVADQAVDLSDAKLRVEDLFVNPKGSARLDMNWRHEPALAQLDFAVKKPLIEVSNLRLHVPGIDATGAITASLATKLIKGGVQGHATDLTWVGGLVHQKMSGSAKLELKLAADLGKQNATLSAAGSNLAGPWGTFGKGTVTISARDIYANRQGTATVETTDFKRDNLAVSHLTAQFEGAPGAGTFKSEAAGNRGQPFVLATAGNWHYAAEDLALVVENLRGKYAGIPVTLDAPIHAQKKRNAYSVQSITISFGKGKIVATAQIDPVKAEASLAINSMPLELARIFGGPVASGQLDAQYRLAGSLSHPEMTLDVSVKDAVLDAKKYPAIPKTAVTANAALKDNVVTAKFNVAGLLEKDIEGNVTLPLHLSLSPFAYRLAKDGALRGDADFAGDLKRFNDILSLDQERIEGGIKGNVQIAGTISAPAISGGATISNATVEDYQTGTLLKSLDLTFAGDGTRIDITKAEGTDGGSGHISATGWMDLSPAHGFPVQVDLEFSRAKLARRADITATATGKIQLAGSLRQGLRITGNLSVAPADIALVQRSSHEELAGLDVVDVNKPNEESPGQARQAKAARHGKPAAPGGPPAELTAGWLGQGLRKTTFDVKANMPGKIFVRGYGLESEWKGSIAAAGNAARPQITGRMEVVRGQLTFLGRRFTLTDSTIAFTGSHYPPVPMLDITAEVKATDITAQVKITGDASKPDITLESTPPLPQDEILSRVLFGRELAKISPVEAVQIAAAANALAGGPKALDVFESTRRLLRLNELSLTSGDKSTDTAVNIGKYLGNKVHVNVEQGLANSQSTKGKVEVDITRHLDIESNVGEKGEGVGFNWKKDY